MATHLAIIAFTVVWTVVVRNAALQTDPDIPRNRIRLYALVPIVPYVGVALVLLVPVQPEILDMFSNIRIYLTVVLLALGCLWFVGLYFWLGRRLRQQQH